MREGFAVGESPDSKNRNQSAGEIEADDVKARQSMSKAERLNTFPKSMKPNQNADVVFWENGTGTVLERRPDLSVFHAAHSRI